MGSVSTLVMFFAALGMLVTSVGLV